jgi:ATP-dependent helicase/nuclease subunit A
VLAARKSDDPIALSQARAEATAREGEEYRRLLYVALTRAEDAVIVCGAESRVAAQGKPHARAEGCWYDLVLNALAPEAREVAAPYGDGDVLRWRREGHFAVSDLPLPPAPAEAAPHRLAFPPYVPPQAARPVRPSRSAAGAGEAKSAPASADGPDALDPILRGDLVHRLLAGLVCVPQAERPAAGQRMLDHAAAPLSRDQHKSLLDEALGVLGHAGLADLFGAGSVAEVPVVGRWTTAQGRAVSVSGRIDRLAMTADALLLVDFKTDRVPPSAPEDIGAAYVSQIALYGEVLRRAFSGKPVEARIVYTRGPRIHRLTPEQLSAALRDLERA